MAQLWGGRFTKATDRTVCDFNASIRFDRRLFHEDIEGSMAHVTMPGKKSLRKESGMKSLKGCPESVRM